VKPLKQKLIAVSALAITVAMVTSSTAAFGAASATTIANAELKKLTTKVLSTGPDGEAAASATSLQFTPAELAKLKGMNATAAIALHLTSDWTSAQLAGLTQRFGQLGIKLVGTTQADFKADEQVSQIQTLMAKKPNILVSIPVDGQAEASTYKAVAAAGTKIVFMDNKVPGMTAGKDYVSVVSADNYANGVASALLLGKALNGKGSVALIYHAADFFVTKQRYQGFRATIKKFFPGIKIIAEKGVAGPDFAGDSQAAATAIITKTPKVNAIWGVWDTPAEGILAALRAAGRTDIKVATEDLGANVAISLAKGGPVIGLGAQRPFDQGIAEANCAAYALLGKTAPAYIALNALPVDHANVLQAWKSVYHANPPAQLRSSYVKK